MRKETLLNGKHTVMKVSLLSGIGLAMLLGSATASLAQLDNQGSSGKCSCDCYVDNNGVGGGSLSTGTYDSHGLPCSAFENKTCNLETAPGIIRTGKLLGCKNASSTGAARKITVLPHGSATLADSKLPKTTTPKAPVTGTTTQRK
jgi:hypothetical protein